MIQPRPSRPFLKHKPVSYPYPTALESSGDQSERVQRAAPQQREGVASAQAIEIAPHEAPVPFARPGGHASHPPTVAECDAIVVQSKFAYLSIRLLKLQRFAWPNVAFLAIEGLQKHHPREHRRRAAHEAAVALGKLIDSKQRKGADRELGRERARSRGRKRHVQIPVIRSGAQQDRPGGSELDGPWGATSQRKVDWAIHL